MTAVTLQSPAKINWTLDILGERDDDYHEVSTVMQTIALADTVTVSASDQIEVVLTGSPGALAEEPLESNLAFRAAALLKQHCGKESGARIELDKRIPIAAGLGGGSSNAAATLRALRFLWQASTSDHELARIGSELGADVPFFLTGGTALATGRGDQIAPLPDIPRQRLLLAWREGLRDDKTAEMYASIEQKDFSDGSASDRLAESIEHGRPVDDAGLYNAFEPILGRVDPVSAEVFTKARAFGKPHLAGSGPAFFYLLSQTTPVARTITSLRSMGLNAIETHILPAADARGDV